MISRVAESCFWLHRYLERLDSTARLLDINRHFLMDVRLDRAARWWPLVIVSGEQERFTTLRGGLEKAGGDTVQRYLTWERDCPVSLASSLYWARENARTIREVISLEMWEALNELWRWLSDGGGAREWESDRNAFYRRVRTFTAIFQGLAQNTILHEEPFDFMRLGSLLERAGQTARVVDVYYHRLGPNVEAGGPEAAAHWIAVLRSCSAFEPFHKRSRQAPTGPGVVDFLVFDEAFPRSITHCLTRAQNFLNRVRLRGLESVGADSARAIDELLAGIADKPLRGASALHAAMTRVVDGSAEICGVIHRDYFDPHIEAAESTAVDATNVPPGPLPGEAGSRQS